MMKYISLTALIFFLMTTSLCFAQSEFDRGRNAANHGDFATARKIWEKLADEGNTNAEYALGRMYARGDGVKRNFAQARRYFAAAALEGNTPALTKLGVMYLNGDGVTKNPDRANTLLRQAAAQGDPEASNLLKEMERKEAAQKSVSFLPSPTAAPTTNP